MEFSEQCKSQVMVENRQVAKKLAFPNYLYEQLFLCNFRPETSHHGLIRESDKNKGCEDLLLSFDLFQVEFLDENCRK